MVFVLVSASAAGESDRVRGINTNLLLSAELGNLRQRRLSIPADPTFLVFLRLRSPKHRQQQTDGRTD